MLQYTGAVLSYLSPHEGLTYYLGQRLGSVCRLRELPDLRLSTNVERCTLELRPLPGV